ncbi:MAG: sigma-70 family RNA polymerase sigma factor [Muribaculaceae bacterium]|nr:sigma-70 family RNA polymerase sigma factor [Muribaculaceae bacterium]
MRNYQDTSDERLISLYVGGCNEAFDELVDRHKDQVYSYIFHSVKNSELADDIFQETFVKAIMTIRQGRYTENGRFPAWITRIAHNLIIDHFRQEKSEKLQSTDSEEVNILNRKEYSDTTIEDSLVSSQINKDIHKLILALPLNQREVLIMRYYRNMSFKEIADKTQVSINTALGRMRYAILIMRRLAEEHNIILTV